MMNSRAKKWRDNNKDKLRLRNKKYVEKNKEKIKLKAKI